MAPAAHAQSYDGYCYAKKHADAKTGTIVGAVIGGLVGSQVSKHERGLGTVGQAQLRQYRAHVRLDRLLRKVQGARDLPVRPAPGHLGQDLTLAGGQLRRYGLVAGGE